MWEHKVTGPTTLRIGGQVNLRNAIARPIKHILSTNGIFISAGEARSFRMGSWVGFVEGSRSPGNFKGNVTFNIEICASWQAEDAFESL